MKCPTCKKEFHPQPDHVETYASDQGTKKSKEGFGIAVQLCPSCNHLVVSYREGDIFEGSSRTVMTSVHEETVIYPESTNKELSDEVPEPYRKDFNEALLALEYSPKASAALSRRLLQKILREKLSIRKKDLSQEIDEFIEKSGAPAYLVGAIDAVRNVGNFAAHPIKYQNTGDIVDVEEGESEWLLEVLESLCDFVFVQPARLDERRKSLNAKLRELGKPELKGA